MVTIEAMKIRQNIFGSIFYLENKKMEDLSVYNLVFQDYIYFY